MARMPRFASRFLPAANSSELAALRMAFFVNTAPLFARMLLLLLRRPAALHHAALAHPALEIGALLWGARLVAVPAGSHVAPRAPGHFVNLRAFPFSRPA